MNVPANSRLNTVTQTNQEYNNAQGSNEWNNNNDNNNNNGFVAILRSSLPLGNREIKELPLRSSLFQTTNEINEEQKLPHLPRLLP